MTEEELQATWELALDSVANALTPTADRRATAFVNAVNEIRRLRSELASERSTHQELWQMVDRELDRIYCDAKGIEQ